jgi:hypothetical protein
MAVTDGLLKACVMSAMSAMSAVPIAPIYWFMARELKSQCRELEQQLAGCSE